MVPSLGLFAERLKCNLSSWRHHAFRRPRLVPGKEAEKKLYWVGISAYGLSETGTVQCSPQ